MSVNADNSNKVSHDEIDLLDLFRRVGKTLKNWANALGTAFLISVVFLLRRWLPLGISIAAAIGVSFLLKATSHSFYTSDIVFRNNLATMDKFKVRDNSGTTSEIISKLSKLHTFCSENNLPALSKAISINPESASNILDIDAFWIIDLNKNGIPDYVDYYNGHKSSDTTNIRMQDRFDVRVKISSPSDLDKVRNGIIKYVENDSLYQQMNQLRLRQNKELLLRLAYDIKQLDSLQKVKYFEETRNIKPATGGQIIFMQEQKTQLVYSDIYSLYSRKQSLESENELHTGVLMVLSDFSTPAKRENGGLYYGKTVIPLFFLTTLLVMILLANKKKLKEIYNKY